MNMNKLVAAAALWAVFLCPANAQTTPAHSVPVSAGPGHTGSNYVGPCASQQYIGGNGSSTDPSCQTLPTLVGDSGSGGSAGMAPAPASGDAAAGKYLKADGTWATPPGAGAGADTTADNIFTGENQFQKGVSYGPSALAPETDLYGYSSARPIWSRMRRDQALGIGSIIGNMDFWGNTSDAASHQWARMSVGVNNCLVRTSISTGPCWGNEATAATASGKFDFWVSNGSGALLNVAKLDDDGLTMIGSHDIFIQSGRGIASPDSSGTWTYLLSFNPGNEVDIQACNNVGVACDTEGASINLVTNSASSNGRKVVVDNTSKGQTEIRSHLSIKAVTNSTPTIGGAWTATAFGGDSGGHIVWTAGTAGTLTFGTPFNDSVSCVVTFRSGVTGTYTATVNAITINSLSSSAGIMDYICINSH